MLPELEHLLILQEKDQQLRRLQLDLKRMPADAARARDRLKSDEAAVAAAKDQLMQNEVAIRNLELQINTRKDTINRLKVQQFETRKNDEFAAIGHEIERYTAEVSKLEDSEIELMEEAERLKAKLAEAERELAATQSSVEAELARIAERTGNINSRVAELEAERAAAAAPVDEDLLARYDRIFQHRGDAAIVELEGSICRGCNMKVTAATVSAAKGDRSLVNCPNCGRFVYIAHFD